MIANVDIERIVSARRHLNEEFLRTGGSSQYCENLTSIADRTIAEVCAPFAGMPLAVVATGGYGRRELAPGSDLDITFIPLEEDDESLTETVRALFRQLVDTFGKLEWPIGYAYRLRSDCPALDDKTRTGLLDARLIVGSREAFESFNESLRTDFPVAEFLIAKLRERREMHSKWHDTPRVAELHVKEGAGGLRDFHVAGWFASVLGIEPKEPPTDSYTFLLMVRNALHIATGRKEDRLVHTRRAEVAQMLGFRPDLFEESVLVAAERLADFNGLTVQSALRARFEIAEGIVASDGRCTVLDGASLSSSAVGVSRAVALGLEIDAAPIGPDVGDGPLVIEVLTSNSTTLRALDNSRLLETMLPEFARCTHMLSTDAMHVYSIGEHSVRAVEELERTRVEQEYAEAWSEVGNARPLFLAALLHDLGKGLPGHHSETGADIANAVCDRFSVGHSETATVVWLVRNHLVFAQAARTHDLSHPETAIQLARNCEQQDRLAMLYLLTVADIRSVSSVVWTPQIASASAELYARARSVLGLTQLPEGAAVYRSEALRRAKGAGTEELLNTMPTHYLLATPVDVFPLHADYIARARTGEIVVDFQTQADSATTDITVCLRDLPQPGLLSRILGVVYAFDLTVHAVRAAGTTESEPVALDVITTSFRGQPLPSTLLRFVAAELQRCLLDEGNLHELVRKHGKDPVQRQSVLTFRFRAGELGILDVETPLGRGMPYRVSRMLAGFGWNVHVARIGQWAGRAVARFYLDTPAGPLTESAVVGALGTPQP